MSNLAAFLFGVSAGMALAVIITIAIMMWYDWRDCHD